MNAPLLARILGRENSLFQEDIEENLASLRAAIQGSRVLVIGAAGSIGSAFVKQLVPWLPSALHLVDPSENNLVELVRDLRSSRLPLPEPLQTYAIAMGSIEFQRYAATQKPFDYVVNFAALKHVRSERDPFSLMRMLDTNVLALEQTLTHLTTQPPKNFFSVSSDKAVNPASLMGASKAFMERLMVAFSASVPCSTARFANVAFSDGSLLHGFLCRLEKRQPLSAPVDVKRYFISHAEAGQLCLLACFLGGNREVFIPRLDAEADLKTFSEIAILLLAARGLTPEIFTSDQEARDFAEKLQPDASRWPCHFSTSDTSGEKPFEEFVGQNETVDSHRFKHIDVVSLPKAQDNDLVQILAEIKAIRAEKSWEIHDMVQAIGRAVPEFKHEQRPRNLDQKM